MTHYNLRVLIDMLTEDEGLRLKPYTDTVGKLSIGIGRNLDDRGITRQEAEAMCLNDIKAAEDDLDRNVPWWRDLTPNRQMVFVNMTFNLGWPRFSTFRRMLAAAQAGDYETTAVEMLDSHWARQVGDRALRLESLMRHG